MNTFNYLLSDFVISNLPAIYGPDYHVAGKQLMVPLSSTWMLNITSIETVNKSLCSLDLSRTQKLSAIRVNDSNLINFIPPSTNTTFLCAFFAKNTYFALTGDAYQNIVIINWPELRRLNLEKVTNLQTLRVLNCPMLSAIDLQLSTFNDTVSNIYVDLFNNNLTNENVDLIYNAFLSGYYFSNNNYTNAYLSICNPVTGTITTYGGVSGLNGLNISRSICGTAPQVNVNLLFASKI